MEILWTAVGIVAVLVVLFLTVTYICFYMAFHASRKEKPNQEEFDIPPGEIYEPYRDVMIDWMKKTRELPCEKMSITSFDGLKLCGKYYEYAPGAPIELMFHGYRGSAERDLCGGIQRCFALGRSALLVDQRTSGDSEGTVITFGVNESKDCHAWVDFMIEHFGPDVRIILTGISMGASTVLMAAGHPLPENVVGILADCGYTSAREIIQEVIRQLHLPAKLLYPFVKWGAKIYGHFDLEEDTPLEAAKRCNLPVILFHGESDDFVPCDMSRRNYEACAGPKQLVTIPGAGHGAAYLVDGPGYLDALTQFSPHYGL